MINTISITGIERTFQLDVTVIVSLLVTKHVEIPCLRLGLRNYKVVPRPYVGDGVVLPFISALISFVTFASCFATDAWPRPLLAAEEFLCPAFFCDSLQSSPKI